MKILFPSLFLTLSVFSSVFAKPEQGIFSFNITQNDSAGAIRKSLLGDSVFLVTASCQSEKSVYYKGLLKSSSCILDFSFNKESILPVLHDPEIDYMGMGNQKVCYIQLEGTIECGASAPKDNTLSFPKEIRQNCVKTISIPPGKGDKNFDGDAHLPSDKHQRGTGEEQLIGNLTPSLTTWDDAIYLLIFHVHGDANNDYRVEFDVSAKSSYGYLSAIDRPLWTFYGVMCLVYIALSLFWFVMLVCNWKSLLRVQLWIGGVLFLGMLEKAVFYGEYQNVNATGVSVRGVLIFAEIVSALKRTLARILVVIVSLGFGIVKPRLGPTLHKILVMGVLYFILGSVEGCLRAAKTKLEMKSQADLLVSIPLVILDCLIFYWIFLSLVHTLRTLRLRRNIIKHALYKKFTYTLIFALLASIPFMVWVITQHVWIKCPKLWKQLWIDDAFWHFLFSIILVVIIILWHPSQNSQMYAFSPLLDHEDEDDEEKDIFQNVLFESVKNRGEKSPVPRPSQDDNLKWVEENISSSVLDAALPSLMDSDEEMRTAKLEMSKME